MKTYIREFTSKLSSSFDNKKEQREYIQSLGYTNIRYSGKDKVFYYDKLITQQLM